MSGISIVQFNPTVGDIDNNISRIIDLYKKNASNSDIVIFPECSVTGYPIKDLTYDCNFTNYVNRKNIELANEIIKLNKNTAFIIGTITEEDGKVYNSAMAIDKNHNIEFYNKQELPNMGVFDEVRNFTPGSNTPVVMVVDDKKIGIAICEDLWHENVIKQYSDIDLLVSLNGSPFEIGKKEIRKNIIKSRITESNGKFPILYVNLVGGQDDIVFDGASFIMSKDACYEFPSFEENVYHMPWRQIRDFNNLTTSYSDEGEAYKALVLALRDFVNKQGLESVIVGLSGGYDSALAASIAIDALGVGKLNPYFLPSKYTNNDSKNEIDWFTKNVKEPISIEIDAIVDAFKSQIKLTGLALENTQARVRGNIIAAMSNNIPKSIILGTSNKSELAMGYGTLYGDMIGGFNILKDVYKTFAFELGLWRNKLSKLDIQSLGFMGTEIQISPTIFSKPPSAELAEDQKDTDSLPEYSVLDPILEQLIEGRKRYQDIDGDQTLIKKISNQFVSMEYKRNQSIIGPKITKILLSNDRRYPIVNKWK